MVNLQERISRRAWRDAWRFAESPAGRVLEVALVIAASMEAVYFYPDNATEIQQAGIQGLAVGIALLSSFVTAFAVMLFWKTPRAMLAEARDEISGYRSDIPVLVIGHPTPRYSRKVDASPSTVWQVVVRNTTPRTVAKNVIVTLEDAKPYTPVEFPLRLHEETRVDYSDRPLVEVRDIRHGDTVRYDTISEPHGNDSASFHEVQWHSGDFETGSEGSLNGTDSTLIEVVLDDKRQVDLLICAVADPPVAVAEQWIRLVRVKEEDIGEPVLYHFALEETPTSP